MSMAASGDCSDTTTPTLPLPEGLSEGSFHTPTPVNSQPEYSDEPTLPLPSHHVTEILQPEFLPGPAAAALEAHPEARALFESPDHLKRLQLPDRTKMFVRVLKNPQTGGLVYLMGTVHVSPTSKDDVRKLIEAVEPDVVAVELDARRLTLLESNLTGSSYVPTTTWEILRRKLDHASSYPTLWIDYLPIFMAQALGVEYACDMLSAVQTARRLTIPVEIIDQDGRYTETRAAEEGGSKARLTTYTVLLRQLFTLLSGLEALRSHKALVEAFLGVKYKETLQ